MLLLYVCASLSVSLPFGVCLSYIVALPLPLHVQCYTLQDVAHWYFLNQSGIRHTNQQMNKAHTRALWQQGEEEKNADVLKLPRPRTTILLCNEWKAPCIVCACTVFLCMWMCGCVRVDLFSFHYSPLAIECIFHMHSHSHSHAHTPMCTKVAHVFAYQFCLVRVHSCIHYGLRMQCSFTGAGMWVCVCACYRSACFHQ